MVCFFRCQPLQSGSVTIDLNQAFEQLSDYHFFTGKLADLQPNARVLPYDLNTPLFSDYAEKARFIWMPENSDGAVYNDKNVLEFPTGTVLIKNFYYTNDERDLNQGKRIIETRLLVRTKTQWEARNYVWNDEQTEAVRDVVGDIKTINWTNIKGKAMQVDYIIPNKNQCKSCHYNKGILEPIGPKIRNLNKSFTYSEVKQNQLEKWAEVGYLKGYEPTINHPKVAQWDNPNDDLHQRAMAYLDVNCGHCHNPNGPANTTGLNLVADAEMNRAFGIFKPSVAAGAGTGGRDYNIVPGKPNESILTFRMESTDPAEMMPELGRRLVHEEGVDLIKAWIEGLKVENKK